MEDLAEGITDDDTLLAWQLGPTAMIGKALKLRESVQAGGFCGRFISPAIHGKNNC